MSRYSLGNPGRVRPPGGRRGRWNGLSGFFSCLALILLLSTCGRGEGPPRHPEEGRVAPAERGGPLTLVDATGATLALPSPPSRILSLVPSGTLTLLALGARDVLVGRTDYDTLPALESLPSVGGGLGPSLERLLSLEPEVVIYFAGGSDPTTATRLRDFGISVFAIRPDGVADIRTIIRQLGTLTGREDAADSLLAEMDATLAEVRRRVETRSPLRVAYLLGGSPPWVAGGGSYIDELLAAAGGTNVFADLGALYAPVSPEELLVRSVDLLLAPEGADLRLPDLDIPLRQVPSDLELPGPGLAHWTLELARILHPEAFR